MSTAEASGSPLIFCPTCSAQVQSEFLIPAGDTQVCPSCRDEYLQRLREGASIHADGYDAIRNEHLKHEASVQSIGFLYLLGGVLMIFGGIATLAATLGSASGDVESTGFLAGFVILYLGLGALSIALGRGFRKLKPWVRIPATILAVIGLISFPIGTLINGYILYLIWSRKGKMVFSPEYQEVIEATPHIKYRTSVLSWILLIVLVLIVIGIVVAGIGMVNS